MCSVAICTPDGQLTLCSGECEGLIAREPRGRYGFGYDPLVFIPEAGRHMAELLPEEKHCISHRGKALACAADELEKLFGEQKS